MCSYISYIDWFSANERTNDHGEVLYSVTRKFLQAIHMYPLISLPRLAGNHALCHARREYYSTSSYLGRELRDYYQCFEG